MDKKTVSKTVLMLLLMGMISSIFLVQRVRAEPRTIFVDAGNVGDPFEDGTQAHPFDTVQDAINAVNPGDTIFVSAGTYNESPRNYRGLYNVSFIGESSSNVIINGSLSVGLYGSDITVRNFTIKGGFSADGFLSVLWGIRIYDNVIESGVFLRVSNSTVENNLIEGGLRLSGGYHVSAVLNVIRNNTFLNGGIEMHPEFSAGGGCWNNVIEDNEIVNASVGVWEIGAGFVTGPDCGYNVIRGNHFLQNGIGVKITKRFLRPSSSIVIENTFELNGYGVVLSLVTNVSIYHNNFVDNVVQVFVNQSSDNLWDNDYPSGGNYWSDYVDVDLHSGPGQDLPGMDGVWDHPYIIDPDNRDRFPLVKPWPAVPISLDFDPHALNLKSKGKWVTAYIQLPPQYDASEIDAATISLNGTLVPELDLKYGFAANASEYLVDHNGDGVLERMAKFERAAAQSWIYETMGIQYGRVSLTLTGKLLDGTPFEGRCGIFVNFVGDANHDGVINVLDAATISAHWYPGPPTGPLGYDVNVDLNKDGKIDVLDSVSVSVNWGMSLP